MKVLRMMPQLQPECTTAEKEKIMNAYIDMDKIRDRLDGWELVVSWKKGECTVSLRSDEASYSHTSPEFITALDAVMNIRDSKQKFDKYVVLFNEVLDNTNKHSASREEVFGECFEIFSQFLKNYNEQIAAFAAARFIGMIIWSISAKGSAKEYILANSQKIVDDLNAETALLKKWGT